MLSQLHRRESLTYFTQGIYFAQTLGLGVQKSLHSMISSLTNQASDFDHVVARSPGGH